MTAFGENTASQKDIGTCDFTSSDAAAQRQGVVRVGTEVPHGGEAPPSQHLPHMLFQRRRRCAGRISPCCLREMNVTVPETGNNGLASAINDACILGNLDFATAADRGDNATGRYNDRIGERDGVRRSVYAASHHGERLSGCGSVAAGSPAEKKEKRDAERIPDHEQSL